MADVCEFRTAKLIFGEQSLSFVVRANVEETWDLVTFPVYLDQPIVRTLPMLKRVVARVRRKYQPESPLHAELDGNPVTLEFELGGESYTFTQARVVEWKVDGELGGEMMEEVVLACEGEEAV